MNTINSTQRSTEGQCIELLMQLRRSLTQQHDVRLAVHMKYKIKFKNFIKIRSEFSRVYYLFFIKVRF